jgi:hypothetical protein
MEDFSNLQKPFFISGFASDVDPDGWGAEDVRLDGANLKVSRTTGSPIAPIDSGCKVIQKIINTGK